MMRFLWRDPSRVKNARERIAFLATILKVNGDPARRKQR
jgi:hypothetical protein